MKKIFKIIILILVVSLTSCTSKVQKGYEIIVSNNKNQVYNVYVNCYVKVYDKKHNEYEILESDNYYVNKERNFFIINELCENVEIKIKVNDTIKTILANAIMPDEYVTSDYYINFTIVNGNVIKLIDGSQPEFLNQNVKIDLTDYIFGDQIRIYSTVPLYQEMMTGGHFYDEGYTYIYSTHIKNEVSTLILNDDYTLSLMGSDEKLINRFFYDGLIYYAMTNDGFINLEELPVNTTLYGVVKGNRVYSVYTYNPRENI